MDYMIYLYFSIVMIFIGFALIVCAMKIAKIHNLKYTSEDEPVDDSKVKRDARLFRIAGVIVILGHLIGLAIIYFL